jgi:hypothetical protein
VPQWHRSRLWHQRRTVPQLLSLYLHLPGSTVQLRVLSVGTKLHRIAARRATAIMLECDVGHVRQRGLFLLRTWITGVQSLKLKWMRHPKDVFTCGDSDAEHGQSGCW